MAGVKTLRKLQIGIETTAGTNVAATTIWRGVGTLEDKRETKFVEEDTGYMLPTNRTYVPKLAAELKLGDTPATFEQFPYILEAGVKTVSAVAEGDMYKRVYTFPTTSQPTLKTLSVEGGDNQQAEEMSYGYVSEFKLSGKAGEALMMGATLGGRQVSTTTFTGALSLPSVEEVLFSKGTLYINNVGSLGVTAVSATLLGMDLTVKTGVAPVFAADNALYFSTTKTTQPEITCTITFEHNSTAVAEIAAWRAQTTRAVRIQWKGTAMSSAGATFDSKAVRLDMYGRYEKFGAIEDQDGNDIVTATLKCGYDTADATAGGITVVNSLASLP
jgi:hypothetical protein